MRSLLSISDVSDDEVRRILERAHQLRTHEAGPVLRGQMIGLAFLSPSLRTRLGFFVASSRLGATAIHLDALRYSKDMSVEESLGDTIRTATGMLDTLIVRSPSVLGRDLMSAQACCPVINAGDGSHEHPTQALIDLFSINELRGPVESLHVVMVGDASMRAARSLISLFARFPPASLTVVHPRGRGPGSVGADVRLSSLEGEGLSVAGADVVYMIGLPPGGPGGELGGEARAKFILGAEELSELDPRSIVIAPLPIIDEISPEARLDTRVKMFEASDLSVYVRMAILELLSVDQWSAQ